MPNFDDFMMWAAVVLIIFLGSVVHATNKFRLAREKKEAFTRTDFFVLLPISVFSGMIFGLAVLLFTDNVILVLLSSGLGSFLGVAGLNQIAKSFLLFLASKIEDK